MPEKTEYRSGVGKYIVVVVIRVEIDRPKVVVIGSAGRLSASGSR